MSAYNRLNQIWDGKVAADVTRKVGSYTVPKLCPGAQDAPAYPPHYNTLSHGVDESKRVRGYFNLTGAYPFADCTTCKMSMVERPCLGQIPCNHQKTLPGEEKVAVNGEGVVVGDGKGVLLVNGEEPVSNGAKEVIEGYLRSRHRRRF